VIETLAADRLVGGDRTAAGYHADAGGCEPSVTQALAQRFVVADRPLENRDLGAVIAGSLELIEDGPVLLGDVSGPEEKIKA
jgi:hypothetical protein